MGIETADVLADHADELARSEPSSARALKAARSGSPITAQEYALRWWGVCRSLKVFLYTARADDLAQAVIAGRRADIADDLDQMIHRATRTVAVFERHAADGVFEASELAQVLRIVSRLGGYPGRCEPSAGTA
ncbi:hypothetical protein [Verrucosispora sp. WMMD573]|uniref:hypothetical protein n=1 Tax=Verrucosispora sp. WMMD573 TaxID=3015149 RepID=UPI00248CC2EE|nr:hypothetical protein [Verrucosispora sp. WMMD573]WBB54424.1 hypothetical protein O7601_28575 [Verrucosispora sp. WMMD573]